MIRNIFQKLYNLLVGFSRKNKIILRLMGPVALIWFLIRVIPKPSRAAYPCQQAAFPIASAFVLWILSFFSGYLSFKKARKYFKESKLSLALVFLFISILGFGIFQFSGTLTSAISKISVKIADVPVINDPDSNKAVVSPRGIVGIVQSNKASATDIDAAEIESMVRQAVALAGGFDTLIKDGQTVVIKPNGVSTALHRINANGQTTDWRIIQAVVNMVSEKNPNGKIYVMEGSADFSTIEMMKKSGWLNVKNVDKFIGIEDSSGEWHDYSSPKLRKVSLPQGKALYQKSNNEYYFNKIYYEADVIISLPVLKTHSSASVTGAIKNVAIGVTPWSIYGNTNDSGKPDSISPHLRTFLDHDGLQDVFHDWLHDYYMARPVDYCIMDALTGLEYGPTLDTIHPEYLKNTRCIIASSNAVSMDAVESLILQKDPFKIRYLVKLHNDYLGCVNPKYIMVKGIRIDQIRTKFLSTCTYADHDNTSPPDVNIASVKFSKPYMFLALNSDSKVEKIEISADNQLLDSIYTKNFKNLTIDLSKYYSNLKEIKIFAYDHYLNCKVLSIQNLDSINEHPVTPLVVYPNPFKSMVSLSSQNEITGEVQISIYNINGKKVANFSLYSEGSIFKKDFDLSFLSTGTYILRLVNGKTTKQINIQKE